MHFSAMHCISSSILEDTVIVGGLGLDGSVLPIVAALPIVLHARAMGMSRVILPQANEHEAQTVTGIDVIGVSSIHETLKILGAPVTLIGSPPPAAAPTLFQQIDNDSDDFVHTSCEDKINDFSDVIGHEDAKYALQIAAAGGHHVLMQGPPGVGKTMLASRLPFYSS